MMHNTVGDIEVIDTPTDSSVKTEKVNEGSFDCLGTRFFFHKYYADGKFYDSLCDCWINQSFS